MGTTSSVQGMRYRDYTAQKTQNHRCQYRKEQTSTQNGQWTEPKEDSFQGADVWYILYQYDALHRLRTRHWSLHLRVLSLREGNAVKPWAQDCSPTGYSSLCGSASFWETALIISKQSLILQRIPTSLRVISLKRQAALKLPVAGNSTTAHLALVRFLFRESSKCLLKVQTVCISLFFYYSYPSFLFHPHTCTTLIYLESVYIPTSLT